MSDNLTISRLIKDLTTILEEYGDLPVGMYNEDPEKDNNFSLVVYNGYLALTSRRLAEALQKSGRLKQND